MESLGQKLREARERHNVSLEQVARDTHISKQYLEALEEESFAIIPGETYIIGFLRNYSEYLGLNPEELVSLYRNLKIQEQPLPMTELLDRGQPKVPRRVLVLVIVLVAVLGAGGYLIYRYLSSGTGPAPAAAAETSQAQVAAQPEEAYDFREEAITRWFNEGDTVVVSLNGSSYRMSFSEMGDKLSVRIPGGTVELNLSEERQLDMNTDGRNDVRIRLNDLDVGQAVRRANVSLYKITKEATAQAEPQPAQAEPQPAQTEPQPAQTTTAQSGGAQAAAAPAAPQASQPQPEQPSAEEAAAAEERPAVAAAGTGTVTLLSASEPSPFRISISFRGYCLLRYRVDNEIRDERFFHKGETFALDARNEAMLWISNAGALRLNVGGTEVEIGRPGAVTAKLIRWSRDEATGQYVLQVLDRE